MKWTIDRCGIYFLFLEGKLQYIGQSQDFYARCKQHRADGLFYDHIEFKACRHNQLLEFEKYFIQKFHPPLNKTFKKKLKKKKHKLPYIGYRMKFRRLTRKSFIGFGPFSQR